MNLPHLPIFRKQARLLVPLRAGQALLLLALALLALVQAPSAAGVETSRPPVYSAPLKVTVSTPAKPLELLDAWRLIVTVQNISSNNITLKKLQWLVPPQLRSTRKIHIAHKTQATPAADANADGDPDADAEVDAEAHAAGDAGRDWDENALLDEPLLKPGQVEVYSLTMPSTTDSGEWWFANPAILTWHYLDLDIPILLTYTGAEGASVFDGTVTETVKVQWQTPFRTLVFGGILGALLAMSFYYFYLRLDVVSRYFNALKADPPTPPLQRAEIWTGLRQALSATFPEHISIAWRQMVTACITVTIVLLLVASGKEGILPISIAVTDFAGAAFLGLIAHKIGKVTFDAIFGGGTGASSSQTPQVPTLKAQWLPAVQQVRITWSVSKDPKVTIYSLRRLTTASDDPLKAVPLKDFKVTDKLELTTSDGLAATGDQAFYVLVLKLADGSEQAGSPLSFTRPP